MFSKATFKFVRQIDPEGSLIHVSRLNDSQKLRPMALVVKRRRFWFWQRPNYRPQDFTLSDVLLGDQLLTPDVSEIDFLEYQGTFGDILSGKLEAKAGGLVSVNLEGRGSSKLQSSFGKLKKQEVNVKRLLLDSNNRLMDMQHALVQQLEKRQDVLAVLKERILTTSPCSVTETCQEEGTCGGMLRLVGHLGSTVEVCVKDSNNMQADSDVSLEIPPGTVIAYSLLELEIKKDGHYELCLQPSALGGFESDSGTSSPSHDSFDGVCVAEGLEWIEEKVPERAPLSALQNELQQLEVCLPPLAQLPQTTRSALFQQLQGTLKDRASLSDLEHTLEQWCRGEAPVTELSGRRCSSVKAVLDLLTPDPDQNVENGGPGVPDYLTAAHLLVSAMEVFPAEALSLLSECSADFLEAFNTLICRLKGSRQPLPVQCLPVLLQDDRAFRLAEQLLRSANVMLRRDTDRLWAETGSKPGVLPLVLCIAVHGLSSLCHGTN